MQTFIAIAALLSVAFGAPSIHYEGKIVNGQNAEITDYPYQVSVMYYLYPDCGGSIISENVVLTAAHCTYGEDHSQYQIQYGDTNLGHTTPGSIIKVAKIIEHELYNPSHTNYDVSILILDRAIPLGKNAQIIPLAKEEPKEGEVATVTGWGLTKENGEASDILQKADVPIISRESCNDMYNGVITEQMICAGYEAGGVDACQSDSGGPLAYKNSLVGVVSWGIGCARPGHPGVYASVPHLYDWIQKHMK